jgi:glycine cleavage system transcriptional repressor
MTQQALVLTATGPDKPGIVERVTDVVEEHGGNVVASRAMRLGGEFAMLMLVSASTDHADALREALRALRDDEFQVATRLTTRGNVQKYAGYIPYEIKIRGADHEGIVHSVTHYLASQGINIETLDTNVRKAPMTGTPLFEMEAVVLVPEGLSYHDLREALEEVGDQSGVDADIIPYTG